MFISAANVFEYYGSSLLLNPELEKILEVLLLEHRGMIRCVFYDFPEYSIKSRHERYMRKCVMGVDGVDYSRLCSPAA